jgi:hypothetical protein
MLPFSLCKKKRLVIRHINRPLFTTKLYIPSYDIGKWVELRSYQLHHVSGRGVTSIRSQRTRQNVGRTSLPWMLAAMELKICS